MTGKEKLPKNAHFRCKDTQRMKVKALEKNITYVIKPKNKQTKTWSNYTYIGQNKLLKHRL